MGRTPAEAAGQRTSAEVATVGPPWDPVPMRSTAVGTSIDMTIVARIGLTIVARIGTAITRPTLLTVAPAGRACGHPTGGAASMCAATSARTADIGTATSARTIGTAIIVRTADIGTVAILARPMDVARAITEPNDKCGCPSSSPARHAGEPSRSLTALADHDSNSGGSATGKSTPATSRRAVAKPRIIRIPNCSSERSR